MAVKIRLKRMGAKKDPFYRIVVADKDVKRDGKALDEIGYYLSLIHISSAFASETKFANKANTMIKAAAIQKTAGFVFCIFIGRLAHPKFRNGILGL